MTKWCGMKIRISTFAPALALTLGSVFLAAPPAHAAATCPDQMACIWQNAYFTGSMLALPTKPAADGSDDPVPCAKDLANLRFFNGDPADNSASSMIDNSKWTIFLYQNADETGIRAILPPKKSQTDQFNKIPDFRTVAMPDGTVDLDNKLSRAC